MTDPTSSAGGAGLIKALVSAITKARGDKAEIVSMQKLVDRKFGEVEATHKLFIDLLHRLEKAAKDANDRVSSGKSVRSATSAFSKVLVSVETARKKRFVDRMNQYAEAAVFQEMGFVEQGIIKKVPDDVVKQLQSFMTAFTGYFITSEIEQHYHHAVKSALDSAYMAIDRLEFHAKRSDSRIEQTKRTAERLFDDLSTEARKWADFSAENWAKIASEYHKLNLLLRQHGYV